MTLAASLLRIDAGEDRRRAEGRVRLSLAPGQSLATPVGALARRAGDAGISAPAHEALVAGLATLDAAIDDAFPENLCGDLDYLVGSLCRGARESADQVEWLTAQLARLTALQHLYGCHTPIRFRYLHDFLYGFDWAKWVAKDPAERRHVGPFDPIYLAFSDRRGHELLALVAADDAKYPKLRDGRARNPFAFSREPEAEIALHRSLAADGLLPVEAWSWDGAVWWDAAFQDLRQERAVALGLARSAPATSRRPPPT